MSDLEKRSPAPPWPRLKILEMESLGEGDELVPLKEVPKLKRLARLNGGRRLAWQRVRRWATKGVKVPQADGTMRVVQLAVIRVGQPLFTTETEMIRFMEELTNPDAPTGSTVAEARRMQTAAERELDRIGI